MEVLTCSAIVRSFAIGALTLAAAAPGHAQSSIPPTAPTSLSAPTAPPPPRSYVSPTHTYRSADAGPARRKPSAAISEASAPRTTASQKKTAHIGAATVPSVANAGSTDAPEANAPTYSIPVTIYDSPTRAAANNASAGATALTTPRTAIGTSHPIAGAYQSAGSNEHYSNPAIPTADFHGETTYLPPTVRATQSLSRGKATQQR